jgi:hypothetical protein
MTVIARNHTGHRVGECHQNARLTDAQVRAIREEYMPYVSGYGYLARKYGCGESTIRDIVQYRTRTAA